MPHTLLKRIIEHASDSTVRDVYIRILGDRRAERGPGAPPETIPSWEQIAARVVDEGVLTREEASRLLAGVKKGGIAL